jgi:hypothetical protein
LSGQNSNIPASYSNIITKTVLERYLCYQLVSNKVILLLGTKDYIRTGLLLLYYKVEKKIKKKKYQEYRGVLISRATGSMPNREWLTR